MILKEPATRFVRTASTAIADTIDSIHVTRVMVNDTNVILVSGFYTTYQRPTNYTFSVRHPAEYFGTVFKEMLEKNGIGLNGTVLVKTGGWNPKFLNPVGHSLHV